MLRRRILAACCVASALALCLPMRAATADDPAWVADARKAACTEAEIAHLRDARLLLTAKERRQIFEPYLGAKQPFVTTDSVLAAYHALLEASVSRMEMSRAARLPRLLRDVWDALPAALEASKRDALRDAAPVDDTTRAAATARVRRTLAVAMRLLGADAPGISNDDARAVDVEVRAVEAASGRGQPAWLGPYDEDFPLIDYDAHRPRGFYDGDDALGRTFRATRWLQSVAFREAIPAEKEAISVLRRADAACGHRLAGFAAGFADFVGPSRFLRVFEDDETRRRLGDEFNESVRAGRRRSDDPAPAPSRRIFPPGDPAENAHFRRITAPHAARLVPDALDVGILLGSAYAVQEAAGEPRPPAGAVARGGPSLMDRYLRTIAALVDAPEPDAPAFLANDAWQAKSLGTALAGWAQERHTYVLQAEESASYLCATSSAPGAVEPDPEFYERLAGLTDATLAALDVQGAFDGSEAIAIVPKDLAACVAWLDAQPNEHPLEAPARARFGLEWAHALGVRAARAAFVMDDGQQIVSERAAARRVLAADIRRTLGDLRDPLPSAIRSMFAVSGRALADRWRLLRETAARLGSMSHRQLRGRQWTGDDEVFFRKYGLRLARLFLYDDESWTDPRDDAPRTVSVHTSVDESGQQRSWHVSVGRPREILVLWPSADGDVLLTGAILPFHESVEDHRLTDAEWRARFPEDATARRPPLPEWLAPLRPAGE